MKKSAVIFDCDGVMFDSRQANINYYNHLLAHFGQPLMTEEMITHVHMNTANESIRHIFRHAPHLIDEALQYAKEIDYTPFIPNMIIEPGLKDLLQKLRPDFGLAVATNRSTTINKVLESNGLDRVFDIVVSSLDVTNPKPHPESLFKILDFFGIESKDAYYVGDSLIDYQTAMGAGVIFIAYKNRNLKADYYADSMGELGKIIRNDLNR
ncbi:MAG: HAD family hydrolase [Deltaproteobacteria bacterium]|nr:HAD family hydrolase [Deltaproteobacteria bacterium]